MSAPDLSGDEPTPPRGGPSKLVALLGFSALVAVALVLIIALVSLGRLLDHWI